MSGTGSYSFLPWLRRGISTKITEDPGTSDRAHVQVKLKVEGAKRDGGGTLTEDVQHNVELYGPGDVIGIDPRAIVRTEPRDWITNFDPNYLAFVEFYEEDYVWRYSPAIPGAGGRLAPWLALIVLTEEEFEDTGQLPGRPLSQIAINDLAGLPPAGQLGAFTHVHVNRDITGDKTVAPDIDAALAEFAGTVIANPDNACARLMCPRRLDPVVAYHAFVVPAFETGRLAGLGLEPAGSPGATHSSWVAYEGRPESGSMPVYHRWSFRTAPTGDFEYLVRLLNPGKPDALVGQRPMDTQEPGVGLPPATPTDPELDRVLRLGGALQVPDKALKPEQKTERDKYEAWDTPFPHPFQTALATLINLSETYTEEQPLAAHQQIATGPVELANVTEDDADPLVTPPLYGRWHALTDRLLDDENGQPLPNRDNWVHELNLDPRFRVAAGIGARVVREHQEEYMQAAWAQIGQVLEANRRIRGGQLAREVAFVLHQNHVKKVQEAHLAKALAMMAPLASRVVPGGSQGARAVGDPPPASVATQLTRSRIAGAPLSVVMRRQTRPGSRLMRNLPPYVPPDVDDEGVALETPPPSLLDRINDEEVRAAPKKVVPDGVTGVDRLERVLTPPPDPGPHIAADTPGNGGGTSDGGTVIVVPNPVPSLSTSSDFVISLPGEGVVPHAGGTDSAEAANFKAALNAAYGTFNTSALRGETPARPAVNLTAVATGLLEGLHPDQTIPHRVLSVIHTPELAQDNPGPEPPSAPPRIRTLVPPTPEKMQEVMAYPAIDLPMFKPLMDLGEEFFLPNLNLIPPDSITLLETSQRFIESYMVGLNHEMARELLWREFPTDQRGTLFRQFWDIRGVRAKPDESPEERRERLLDIPPIHAWTPASKLGDHDNRELLGEKEDELVLVIRGELLKKYPTTVVYAHKARWQLGPDGKPDPTQERRLVDPGPTTGDPDPNVIQMPLYEAKADPDIYFFGFDITEEEAKGGDPLTDPDADAGWFFVLKERPGDPRFGLDINREGELQVWNDLAWTDVLTTPPNGAPRHLDLAAPITTPVLHAPDPNGPDGEKAKQYQEDKDIQWSATISPADLAYILYQAPVMVAVHAEEMLGDG
ncbi:MAG: hypothetical protein GEV11_12540 [Streptosporangiales bacterium]|nr:hypothetical protein [Streptosporangiales bacterium]